ncbi:MAG: hypothetical protein JW841_18775 [Deltaproteobacteria bacterium]|nr:hypothetical protein [Deltaproteobacteria bacterium]
MNQLKRFMLKFWGTYFILLLLVSGCGGLNMEKHYQKMRGQMVARDYDDASKYLDKVKQDFYGEKNRLLFYMDKGMVLHLAGKYKESNQFLEKAKTTAQDLWTESVGSNAAAWITTDNALPYQGEDFEKVFIHFVAALNFIDLADYDAARVEARQITNKLELYNSKYTDKSGKNAYKDDAFSRWLSGKLAETEGSAGYNDAWIDYKKALDVYRSDYVTRYGTPVPRFLVGDALRALTKLGPEFSQELATVKAKYPNVSVPDDKGMGEVILLHLSGEAPYKIDKFWDAKAGNKPIRIAYPEFVPKPFHIASVRVISNNNQGTSELAENVTAIAKQNLNDHMARIKAKAIARAIAKAIAAATADAAGKNMGNKKAGAALQLASAIFSVASAVNEQADKRSWITLPAAINVARIMLPAGDHELQLEFLASNGNVIERGTVKAKAVAGRPTFVSYRTYR